MDDGHRLERFEEQLAEIAPPAADESGTGAARDLRQALPRIRVDVFVDDAEDRAVVNQMAIDRRAERATIEVFDGSFEAACTLYKTREAADLIIVEHLGPAEKLTDLVDRLADYCHENARVIIIGDRNDVDLYRRLARRGVSDYLVRPISPVMLLETLFRVLEDEDMSQGPLGSIIAIQGARGGVGASTTAHNVADALATRFSRSTILIDAYDGFGSASMQFDVEPSYTLDDVFKEGAGLTPQILESRVHWRDKRLGILAAPVRSEPAPPLPEHQFERILSLSRRIARHVVVDLPTRPNQWTVETYKMADEVCIIGTDDLPTLRNANTIFAQLRRIRPNDAPGRFVLNKIAGKAELVPASQFKRILGVDTAVKAPLVDIARKAEHTGRMLREEAPRAPIVQCINQLAALLGEVEAQAEMAKGPGLFARLRRKTA